MGIGYGCGQGWGAGSGRSTDGLVVAGKGVVV
jgi:hypothetical protein